MRIDFFGLTFLLLASMAGAWLSANKTEDKKVLTSNSKQSEYIEDNAGYKVPCRNYQRIACVSTVANTVVPELLNTNRMVLTAQWFADNHADAFRVDHLPSVSSVHGVEAIVSLNPDLIIVNSLSHRHERITRLRETGIPVLDLGSMLGWNTLRNNIIDIGKVICEPERSKKLLLKVQNRFQQAAAHIPESERKTAMWLAVYGDKLAGGTIGSSYHDILRFAGLKDIVAGTVDYAWPSFSLEDVLTYDPDYIITDGGMSSGTMAEIIKAMPGLKEMRAVKNNNIISMPAGTDTTGLGLIDAVEFLCQAVYGPAPIIEEAELPELYK